MPRFRAPLKLAILALGCLPLFASLAQAKCLEPKMLDLIQREFEIYEGERPADLRKLKLCDSENLTNQTLAALSFLKTYSFLPMLSTTVDHLILGQDAWEYFKERIHRLEFTPNGIGLCGEDGQTLSVVAYHDPADKVPTMHICKAFADIDLLTQVAVLVHEARHTQGYGHVDCSRGPLKGEKVACDTTYRLRGSYATEAEYKMRLAKHDQVDPILRRSSRVDAVADLFQRFNDEPLGLREVAIVQADDGSVFAYDGKGFERVGIGTPTQVMVERDGEPTLFDAASGSVKTYALGQVTDSDGWLAARFRELGKGRADFKDALYGSEYQCLLFASEMRCGSARGPHLDVVIHFSRIHPVGFLYRAESLLVKTDTPYLVADTGALYPLPVSHRELMKLKEAELKARKAKKSILKLATYSSKEQGEYVLTQDGRFMLFREFEDGTRSFDEITPPDRARLKSVVSPMIWSKGLRSL